MDYYQVEFTRSAVKELRKIDRQFIPRITEAVDALCSNSRPDSCKKLAGADHSYRIRVGDYRIIYDIQDSTLVILVIRVRHRRDAYRS